MHVDCSDNWRENTHDAHSTPSKNDDNMRSESEQITSLAMDYFSVEDDNICELRSWRDRHFSCAIRSSWSEGFFLRRTAWNRYRHSRWQQPWENIDSRDENFVVVRERFASNRFMDIWREWCHWERHNMVSNMTQRCVRIVLTRMEFIRSETNRFSST